jgi:hypothetical protein
MIEGLAQRLRFHDIGVAAVAVGERTGTLRQALPIDVHDQVEAEPLRRSVAKRGHLAELPRRVDVQDGKGQRSGMEGLAREVEEDGGVLADRVEEHRPLQLGGRLAQDEDAFGLELAQFTGEGRHEFVTAYPSRRVA